MPLPTIPSGNVASALGGGFEVANSCRFNDGDSAEITRTLGTPTNADKFTLSMWVKRGTALSAEMTLFTAASSDSNGDIIRFSDSPAGAIEWQMWHGGLTAKYKTTRVFRDPSAWYHLVFTYDSGNATAGDRMKIYVNGVEETLFGTETNVAVNTDSLINSAVAHSVGQAAGTAISASYFDGYMAEVVMCDGQTYAASDFGEYDEDSPTIWKPKDVSGLTFGNNGFYLDFEDSANLGNDANGGTDWAEVNIVAADQATDTPTNNFCTMNPLENYIPAHGFSEGNNTITTTDASETYTMSTIGVNKGLWYFEALLDGSTYSIYSQIGVADTKGPAAGSYLGSTQTGYGYDNTGNYRKNDDASIDIVSYGNTFSGGDILGVYLDLNANKLYFGINGTIQNSGTGISITAAASTTKGNYFFCVGDRHHDDSIWHCNFGNGSFSGTAVSSGNADANGYGNFEYNPSTGTFDSASKDFLALCTKNLAEYG